MQFGNRQNGEDVDALEKKADQLSASGQHEEAISVCTRAIEIDPNDARLFYHRGNAWLALKKNEKALSDLSQAVKLQPKNPHTYASRALVHYVLQNWDDVIQDNNKAYELREGMSDDAIARVLYCRAMAHRAQKNSQAAEADFRLARKYDPDGKLQPANR